MTDITTMSREKLLSILTIAFEQTEFSFMRKAIEQWLEKFPGDLKVELFKAVMDQCSGETDIAKQQLKRLVSVDPTFLDAYIAIADIYPEDENIWGYLFVLTGEEIQGHSVPFWAKAAHRFLERMRTEEVSENEEICLDLLAHSGRNVLVDLIHLYFVFQHQSSEVVKTLAAVYHERWPRCCQIQEILADAKIKTDDGVSALKLLTACAGADRFGQTAEWVWPDGNPYHSVWPNDEEIVDFIQIPASIASVFGWNLLQQGELVEQEKHDSLNFHLPPTHIVPKEVSETKKIFEGLARGLRKEAERKIDGRYPIYVVLSSRTGLVNKFGMDSANVLLAQAERLVEIIQEKRHWGAMMFLPDDTELMGSIGLPVIEEIDPWKVKLALHDLDHYLGKKGAMIGAVLIVGGHEVIPFHALPNPTDDVDDIVYSDNPYGCIDANYFVPDWPVGRLPDEEGNDTGLLMQQFRRIIKNHQAIAKSKKTAAGTMAFPFEMLLSFFKQLFNLNRNKPLGETIGYTASVWRRAAIGAYRPIGASNLMAVSPPVTSENVDSVALLEAELAYYNLHGIIDGGEWFGQKSFTDTWEGSDFPIAITPTDFTHKGRQQQIIVSEACYGAYTLGKEIDGSLALKFLSLDAKAYIGSTAIAYGSIQPPLIGADLLANRFWTALVDGKTVGESLLTAKYQLAQEMNKRQNYLDAEDQKTLLSFVLFGDPLAQYQASEKDAEEKAVGRVEHSEELYILTENENEVVSESDFTAHTVKEIKAALETYLPGIEFADYSIQQQLVLEEESMLAKLSANPPERLNSEANGNFVVSFKQQFQHYPEGHQFFTKVTVDKNGKMLKISMSR